MPRKRKVDNKTMQERVHEVSLLLRRKSQKYIIHYITEAWKVDDRQARNYIRKAKKEWEKYYSQVKKVGMAYHVAQIRDLKDQANEQKIVIGKGDNKQIITIANLPLILDITKEEAKLMGIYPAEKYEETRKVIILGKKEKEEGTDKAR